jgi:hypothetical protein
MRTDETRLSTDDIVGADRDHDTDDRTEPELDNRHTPAENDEAPLDNQTPPRENDEAPLDNQTRPRENDDAPLELFGRDDVDRFRVEWREIQARFVDDPRDAVQGADHLVAEVMRSLATTFSEHKHELEGQWQEGSDAETEDLRQALRHYRTFFNQLLSS